MQDSKLNVFLTHMDVRNFFFLILGYSWVLILFIRYTLYLGQIKYWWQGQVWQRKSAERSVRSLATGDTANKEAQTSVLKVK